MAERIICLRCGEDRAGSSHNYYSSSSDLSYEGKIPICRKCIDELYNYYLEQYDDERVALFYLCRKLDIAFISSGCDSAIKQTEDNERFKDTPIYKIYIGLVNGGTKKYVGAVEGGFDVGEQTPYPKENNDEIDDIDGLMYRWGSGYDNNDYDFLERRYSELTSATPAEYESDVILFKQICQMELDIRNARESGANATTITKLTKELRDLMGAANIRSTDIKQSNAGYLADSYGMWIKEIEETEPAEYFDKRPLFEDFDSITLYFKNHVFRPLKNLLVGSRDFDIKMDSKKEDE